MRSSGPGLARASSAGRPGRRAHHRRRRQAPAPRWWCCWPRQAASPGDAAGGRPHIEAAAFIEFIHTATLLHDDVVDHSAHAPRPRHRQRAVRQPGQRAGRRFRLFARLPDDGRRRLAARHGDHGRRHQRDRRGRGAAADERAATRTPPSSATSRSSTARPRGCSRPAPKSPPCSAARRRTCRRRWRATAGTSAPPTS